MGNATMAWFSSLAGKDDDFRTRDDGDSDYDNPCGENTPPCTPCGSQYQLVPELECPEAPQRRRFGAGGGGADPGQKVAAIPAANVRHLFRKLNVNKVSSFLKFGSSRTWVTDASSPCCTASALSSNGAAYLILSWSLLLSDGRCWDAS